MNPEQTGGPQTPPEPNNPNQNPQPQYAPPTGQPAPGQTMPAQPVNSPNPAPSNQPAPAAPQQPFTPQASYGPQPNDASSYNPRDYGFIVDPPQSGKKIPLSGGSTKQRAMIIGGGLLLLIIIVVVFAQIFKGPNKFAPLSPVAQHQTELVRVAKASENTATSETSKDLAYNVALSLSSDNSQLLNYLGLNNHKLDSKTLGLLHSASTDTVLANAKSNSTYDSTFTKIVQNDLASYTQSIQKAYRSGPGPKGEALLKQQYANAQLLAKQAKQPQQQ